MLSIIERGVQNLNNGSNFWTKKQDFKPYFGSVIDHYFDQHMFTLPMRNFIIYKIVNHTNRSS